MLTRRIGSGGPDTTAIGLGTGSLALEGRPSEGDAVRVIHAALDAGTRFIDTADAYCLNEGDVGYGERLVKRALHEWTGARDDVFVATKGGVVRPGGAFRENGHPRHLREACERSLRALGVSSIRLYYLHRPDRSMYFPDSVGALADLRREGKIQLVGLSNVDLGHLRVAREIVPVACVQNLCSPFHLRPFADGVIEECEREGTAFVAYSPMGSRRGLARIRSTPALVSVAARHGVTPFQIALAWLLGLSPCLLVIPGASRPENAVSGAGAARVVLDERDRAAISRAFPFPGFVMKQLLRLRRNVREVVRDARRGS